MTKLPSWELANVDIVDAAFPGFFHHSLRDFHDRCTLQVGELVKIVVRTHAQADRSSFYQRWLTVAEVLSGQSPRFAGDLNVGPGGPGQRAGRLPDDGSTTIEFGPESVYRMEPRIYTLWSTGDVPEAITGNHSHPRDVYDDADDKRALCDREILTFNASGWAAAMSWYQDLAKIRSGWPASIV